MNRGKDQAADFYPAARFRDRFRDRFHRPDVVAKALTALDEDAALRMADADGAATSPVPVVRILAPEDGAEVRAGQVTLRAAVRSPDATVDAVWATVDDSPAAARGLRVAPAAGADGERIYTLVVAVPARDCSVSVHARSGARVGAAAVRLAWSGPAPPDRTA